MALHSLKWTLAIFTMPTKWYWQKCSSGKKTTYNYKRSSVWYNHQSWGEIWRTKSICRFPQMRCVIIGIGFPFQSVLSAPSACFSINYGSWQIIRSNWHLLGSKQLRLWPWDCGVSKLLPNHFIGAPRLFSPSIYGHLDFWIRRWLGCSPKKFVELSKSSSTLD